MMILNLIINFLAFIGFVTLTLAVLAIWACISDPPEEYEYPVISDDEVLALHNPIPSATKKEATAT